MNRERLPLLSRDSNSDLSLLFATLCVVDIFGVFPIIALPCAIVQCGLYGIPLVLIVLGLQIYTAVLLGKSWMIANALDPQISRQNRHPLAAVTEITLGPRAKTLVTMILDLTVFGCSIPNLLVASQNLQMFGLKVSGQRFDLSFCYWLLVVGVLLCPIMWLGSPRDMKYLASLSCSAVILTALLIWWCIIADDRELNPLPVPTAPTWDKFISGYGMLAFQFDVHPSLMTVQVDMRRPQDISKAVVVSFLVSKWFNFNKNVKNLQGDNQTFPSLNRTVFVSGSMFAVTASLAAWKYGGSTTANVLQVIPGSFAMNVAILLAALQLCLSSALGHSALFQGLEDQWNIQRSFGWKRCAIRSAVVFLGVAVGESVPRFDIVMALIGGSLTGPLVFVLPPLMYSKAMALKARSVRTSTPEIYSGSERRRSTGSVLTDPRMHSRSIYYGVLGVPKTDYHRYSYVYYNDLDDEYDDVTDDESCVPSIGQGNDEFLMTRRNLDVKPIFVDASRPAKTPRRVAASVDLDRTSLTNCDPRKWNDWIGYLIVLFGIAITASSTYINIKNTIRFVQFTPPCIVNATVVQSPV